MANPLYDMIGVDYAEGMNTENRARQQDANPFYSMARVGSPGTQALPSHEEAAKSFYERYMGPIKEAANGFMERNDFMQNLVDNTALVGKAAVGMQNIIRQMVAGEADPTLEEDLKGVAGISQAGKSLLNDPSRLDWNPVTRESIARNLDEKYNLNDDERTKYVQEGIMPARVIEAEEQEQEKMRAAIESKGGHLRVIADSIQEQPYETMTELGLYFISNPQYLAIPQAYSGTVARLAKNLSQVPTRTVAASIKAAGVGAEAAAGAALAAGGTAVATSRETGTVNVDELVAAGKIGAAGGFIFGAGQALLKPLRTAGDLVKAKAGIQSADVQAQIITYSQKHKVSLQVAAAKVLETYDLNPSLVVDEINKVTDQLLKKVDPSFVGPKTKRQMVQDAVSTRINGETPSREQKSRAAIQRGVRDDLMAEEGVGQPTRAGERPKTQDIMVREGMDALTSQEPPPGFMEARAQVKIPPESAKTHSDPAYALFTSKAYRPKAGTITEPVMTFAEFLDSPLGLSASGKKLSGAAAQAKYMKFHRDLLAANRDPNRTVTLDELREIMSEKSPEMKAFFMNQARQQDMKVKDLPPSVQKERKRFLKKQGGYIGIVDNTADGKGFFRDEAISAAANQSAKSRETLIYMHPRDFLRMAERFVPDPEKTAGVENVLKGEGKFSSLPMLSFENQGGGIAKVIGHEGRHRAMTLLGKGIERMPVRFISTEGKAGSIRWGTQDIEFDRLKGAWPKKLIKQGGADEIPFPVGDIRPSRDLGRKAAFKGQKGELDPKLAAGIGLATVTALVAYAKTGELEDAIKYAAMVGGGLFAARVLHGYLKGRNPVIDHLLSPPKTKLDLNKLYNKWQGDGAVLERKIISLRESLKELSRQDSVTGKVRSKKEAKALREQITDALESGNLSTLPKEGQEIAKMVRAEFDKIGKEMKDTNVIDEVLNNYVAHLWQHPTKSVTELLDAMFEGKARGIATKSMHEKQRVIPTYTVGQQKGLKPRTKDIADILAIYQKAVDQAKRNTELVHTLRRTRDPVTDQLIVVKGIENAPKTYRSVNHPRFAGYAVHPDIAPVIKSIFTVAEFSAPVRGALSLNFFLKRMAVSLSAFHAKALLGSALMAGGIEKGVRHPITSTKNLINTFRGKSPHLEMLRKGPAGDDIDLGLRNGLVLNTVDDVGTDTFYGALDDIRGSLDAVSRQLGPILGAPTKLVGKGFDLLKASNLWVDGMMWDRIYTGFKVSTFLDKMQKLSAKYGHVATKDELARLAAEFTNDAYGGLNWLRLAENVTNRYGRSLAYSLVSKEGRAGMQTLLFAPDWTTANIRVFYKAFANKNSMQRSLYRGYQLRGMLMFMVMGDVLNYQMTGHHIWDNRDPTSVEFGDGTRMVLSKQFMEPVKWLTKPEQEAINKLSTMTGTSLQLITGKKWLTGPGQYAPPIENRLQHVLGKALPIWAQQGVQNGPVAGMKSMMGFPVYGTAQATRGIPTEGEGMGGGAETGGIAPRETSKSGVINRVGDAVGDLIARTSPQASAAAAPINAPIIEKGDTPSEFIYKVYPAAEQAASQIGVPTRFLLGLVANETGWGKHVLEGTNNLGNIKADPSWEGAKSKHKVWEVINGKKVNVTDDFRNYNTIEEALQDWVNFLTSNPRYSSFLKFAKANPNASIKELSEKFAATGYATDPKYASKLRWTAEGRTMNEILRRMR